MTAPAGHVEPLELPDYDQPRWTGAPAASYLICTSQRSGSNFLCGLLLDHGGFGVPFEYFNEKRRTGPLYARLGLDPDTDLTTYLRRLVEVRTTPNGAFGAKLHGIQLNPLLASGALPAVLPNARYVFLRRKDIVAQAVSLAVALQTDAWTSHGQASREPEYNEALIFDCVKRLLVTGKQWTMHFKLHRIEPLVCVYESLEAEPQAWMDRIADFVGVERKRISAENLLYERQSDDRKADWATRFRAALEAARARARAA